ncbi:Mariner Mos1 transposase [Araneus ventricosus]|uniref:Mariner Mos1 transposase n=1 Tax=Araneus ventricosus TaxID=182803 RepID=A0A4Y2IWY8_ARAVE|nr:Mariner Mos1 transposase [Araneus ventricosus]
MRKGKEVQQRAHSIVHHQLDFRKLCSQWIPYSLTSEHKGARFDASLEFLQRYSVEGNDFLSRIITGDETWVHRFTPETKQASMARRHTSSPVRTKSKVPPSADKVMTTVSFDCEGVVYTEFKRKGRTINAESNCETLRGLLKALKNKRRGKLSKGIVLLHDNARPHKARATQGLLFSFGWEVRQHPALIMRDLITTAINGSSFINSNNFRIHFLQFHCLIVSLCKTELNNTNGNSSTF